MHPKLEAANAPSVVARIVDVRIRVTWKPECHAGPAARFLAVFPDHGAVVMKAKVANRLAQSCVEDFVNGSVGLVLNCFDIRQRVLIK